MLLYLYTIEYQIHYIISPFNPLADIIPHDSTYIRNFQPLQGMMKNDRRNLGIGHRKNSFLHSGFQNSLYQFRLTDIEALPDLLLSDPDPGSRCICFHRCKYIQGYIR